MLESPQDAVAGSAHNVTAVQALYTRPMPGGGCVRVEMLVKETDAAAVERLRGRVVMERRAPTPATPAEEHVIVEEMEGDDPNVVAAELFRIARDNAAIARRVLRKQAPIVLGCGHGRPPDVGADARTKSIRGTCGYRPCIRCA